MDRKLDGGRRSRGRSGCRRVSARGSSRGRPARARREQASFRARPRLVPLSSSERNITSSISSPICTTSSRASSIERPRGRRPATMRCSRSADQPCERRPQLVGDRGGEACPQLLVGGEVAGRAEIEQRLGSPADVERNLDRRAPEPCPSTSSGTARPRPGPEPPRGRACSPRARGGPDRGPPRSLVISSIRTRVRSASCESSPHLGMLRAPPPAEEPCHQVFTSCSPEPHRGPHYRGRAWPRS